MTNKRINYTDAQLVFFVSQVDRVCPLCSAGLFYKKKSQSYKDYAIAHIYPLNPKPSELELLKNENRLSSDVNHEDNLIALCNKCHGRFDKPRTVNGYRKLVAIKERLIAKSLQEMLQCEYAIEKEIGVIIDSLYSSRDLDVEAEIEFSPKSIDEKLDDTISILTENKIKSHVRDYFYLIRNKFSEVDESRSRFSDLVSLQIKTYYLKQTDLGLSQQEIYDNIASWIFTKTKSETRDAAEIITSFFIQNCEVFE